MFRPFYFLCIKSIKKSLQTYGAEEDKTLGIENEDATNVVAARNFVGWYNGLPTDKNLKVSCEIVIEQNLFEL